MCPAWEKDVEKEVENEAGRGAVDHLILAGMRHRHIIFCLFVGPPHAESDRGRHRAPPFVSSWSWMEMGPVASFLRAVALLLCLCAGQSFVVLPTAHGAGRRAASAPAVSSAPAGSQPVHGECASSTLVAQPRYSCVLGRALLLLLCLFSLGLSEESLDLIMSLKMHVSISGNV